MTVERGKRFFSKKSRRVFLFAPVVERYIGGRFIPSH